MSPRPKVLLIVTLDTKAREAAYVRETLEANGVEVTHLDASIRRIVDGGAEIGPEAVALAAGSTLEDVRALKHEGKCQAVMTAGALAIAARLQAAGELNGVLGIGGSMGTTLATAVMRRLPYGLPKLMISTMASGFTRPFVGNRDIMMLNSVCDIAGLNTISREVFRNGAISVAAMARAYRPPEREDKPLVMISTLSTTDKCSVRVREALTRRGYEVMVFHTLGTGGMTLDDIVREREIAAVVDMSLVEINDFLQGGLCSAGPDRAQAALRKGVPTIFAPGNIDFMVAGPIEQARIQFPGKRYHMHNAALTAVRAEAAELKALADHMGTIIGNSRVGDAAGPVSFLVPLRGFSAHDSEQGYLHDPSLPPVFLGFLRAAMPAGVPVREIDCHINDEPFADALIEQVLKYTQPQARAV
jgi:uncharacterized protein (UPF0261 family)